MKLTFFLNLFSWLCLSSLMSSAENSVVGKSVDVLFSEANQQFDQANNAAMRDPAAAQDLYQQSILKYQYVAEHSSKPTAAIYLNLGNAYFQTGEHGHAVRNYQRALSIDPIQSEALHNLAYLRSITVDDLPISRSQRVTDALFVWHRWSASVRITLIAFANLIFWGVLARRLYQKDKWHWIALTGSGAITIIFTLSLLSIHYQWNKKTDAVIVSREVIARQGNGFIYDNAFTSPLHAGTEFAIIEQRGDWYHARLLNGKSCWIPSNSSLMIHP